MTLRPTRPRPVPAGLRRSAVLGLVALVLAGCGGTYEPIDPAGLAECYRLEFGEMPPAGVTNLHAKRIVLGDSARTWLRFEAPPEVVEKLVKRFGRADEEVFDEHSGGSKPPAWWTPAKASLTDFYGFRGWRRDFTYSFAVLAHDARKRLVYFSHDAFD